MIEVEFRPIKVEPESWARRDTPDIAAKLIADALGPQYANVDSASVLQAWPLNHKTFWRVVSKHHHPDHGGDPELFKQLVDARGVLDRTLS